LGALTEQAEFELVHFENQPARGGKGVPDAEVRSSCRILIETKLKRNAVNLDQLKRHLDRLDKADESVRCLLVLTPHEHRPDELVDLPQDHLSWASFSALDQAIDELFADETEVISELEAFLLRELQVMLIEEDLLGFAKDTVIVPARSAWPEYQKLHVYACQAGRPFQGVQYMGFYTAGHIMQLVPRIIDRRDHVRLERGLHKGELGRAVNQLLEQSPRQPGAEYQVFLLSAPDDPQKTIRLDAPIVNDLRSASGRPTAFVMGQRYVRLDDLRRAKRTSDVVESGKLGSADGKART